MGPKVKIGVAVLLWILSALTLTVLIRDLVTAFRVSPGFIRAYNLSSAAYFFVFVLVFGAIAFFLSRQPLQRRGPRIALAIAVLIAIVAGVNASFVVMPDATFVPRLMR